MPMATSLLPGAANGAAAASQLGRAAGAGCESCRMVAGATSACCGCRVQLVCMGAGRRRGAGRLNCCMPCLLPAVSAAGTKGVPAAACCVFRPGPAARRSTTAGHLPCTAGSAPWRSLAPGSCSVSSGVRSSAPWPPPACACCCRRRARHRARISPPSGPAPGSSPNTLPAEAAGGLPDEPRSSSPAALPGPAGSGAGPGSALCGGCGRRDRKRLYLSAKLLPCCPVCVCVCACTCCCRRARHSAKMSPEEAEAAEPPSAQLPLLLVGAPCRAEPAKVVLPAGVARLPAAGVAAAAPWLGGIMCRPAVYLLLAGAASAAPSWHVVPSGRFGLLACNRSCGGAACPAGCSSRAARRAAGVSPPLL